MYYMNTHALECNVVSNIKLSAKNFPRFKILGAPKGPRNIFCLFFRYYTNTPAYECNFLQKIKSNQLKAFGF